MSAAIAKDASPAISYTNDIRPILSSRCFSCHGPDEHSRAAGLRLDQPDGSEGAIGYAIEPGSADDSEMWHRITSDDVETVMPPPEAHLPKLSPEEQTLIRRWIDSGAPYEKFWAFSPPVKPIPPVDVASGWSDHPIDAFVMRKLASEDLQPSPPTDPRTLLRRLTFDLTGLPPSRDEIREFLAAYEQSPEQAYEECVDRLISRPQYGEHFSRYWLDLVRFADTNGMHKDFYRNHIAYRDWVIQSFNENLPYDEFVRYQVAGDLFDDPTTDQLVASGFNRLHLIIDRGTALPEESRFKNGLDRLTAVGTAFMGLTVQCAQCHDHKFDPITQKDFYSLFAFFDNLDADPETDFSPKYGMQPPFIERPTPEQAAQLSDFDKRISSVKADIEALEESKRGPMRKELQRLENAREAVSREVFRAMVMRDREVIEPTHVRERGVYDALGDVVPRATPAFLPPLKKSGEVATRMDLANWFVAPENPLTARVAVNRFWQQFFGTGLIKTSEDFGNQGDVPSHPELLDHLTIAFVESGWDVKALAKQIVMSRVYRQSSLASPEMFNADRDNRMLARGPRYRLDAEMIRDQILASSGLLSGMMFGPSVKPPQPAGLWEAVTMTNEVYQPDQGEAILRRSVYTYWKRGMPPPQMTILNAPIRDACIARRERTNTPLQALLLLNEPQYFLAARHLAQHVLQQPQSDRIPIAWETVTARLPDDETVGMLELLLADLKQKYRDNPSLADEVCRDLQLTADEKIELAAWTVIGNTLHNLDITKTKD